MATATRVGGPASPIVGAALGFARQNRRRAVTQLQDFVRIPSVGGERKHAADVQRCAEWLVAHLRSIGLENARAIRTKGHPIVYASDRRSPALPTLLIYGHYDVQPADPIGEWTSPPFSGSIQGHHILGRGAADDKGQLFVHLKAIESYLRTAGSLPANIECILEGEEETGSANLLDALRSRHLRSSADVAVISDTTMPRPNRPGITYSLRGACSFEIEVSGPKRDLHSGLFGGAVLNPIQVLCDFVNSLHDPQGRIAIPGVYGGVRKWSVRERAYMQQHGPSDADLGVRAGVSAVWGEEGFTAHERTTIRPALTINGITGGYQGPGTKAIIPARASVKIGIRLAPDQNPKVVQQAFRRKVKALARKGVTVRLKTGFGARSVVIDSNHPAARAAESALRLSFGIEPWRMRSGGTIPVVNLLQEELGIHTVMMGLASPDSGLHGPNEKFHLPTFFKGIEASIRFMDNVSRISKLRIPSSSGLR